MDAKELEEKLYAAFLHAAMQMGARVKGMSCFVRNWGAVKPLADATAPMLSEFESQTTSS